MENLYNTSNSTELFLIKDTYEYVADLHSPIVLICALIFTCVLILIIHIGMFWALHTHLAIRGPRFLITQTKNVVNILNGAFRFVAGVVIACGADWAVVVVLVQIGLAIVNCSMILLFYLILYEYISSWYNYNQLILDDTITETKTKIAIALGISLVTLINMVACFFSSLLIFSVFITSISLFSILLSTLIVAKRLLRSDATNQSITEYWFLAPAALTMPGVTGLFTYAVYTLDNIMYRRSILAISIFIFMDPLLTVLLVPKMRATCTLFIQNQLYKLRLLFT